MGNQHSRLVIDGERCNAVKIQQLIVELKQDIGRLTTENEHYKTQCLQATEQLERKNGEIRSLTEELDKVRSVLDQKVAHGRPDILATVQEEPFSKSQSHVKKKQGVSGESSQLGDITRQLPQYDKDFSSKHLIKVALRNNDFLKNLDKGQVHEIVNCMYEEIIPKGSYIIRETEAGNHLYVSAEGTLEVDKNGKVLAQLQPGTAFGELAILYGCTRTASIKAVEDAKVWVLERKIFQAIMMRTGIERQRERIDFLSSVESLKNLRPEKLAKIADVLDVDFFEADEYIIREGEVGDSFYVISDGKVKVTQRVMGYDEPQEIRQLSKGMYFGERALLNEERRTASVIALNPGVELLTLNREAFTSLIGELTEFKKKDYGDDRRQAEWKVESADPSDVNFQQSLQKGKSPPIDPFFKDIELAHFEILATLGIGGFGRVELAKQEYSKYHAWNSTVCILMATLENSEVKRSNQLQVQYKHDKTKTYALKCLKKVHIVETRQQEHVYSEKMVMMNCRSPYIVRLYKTFKDKKFVYMMMEACLGGELWTILRDKNFFEDGVARFAVACVLKAFQYLHGKGILYRDLKPENLLVTADGFIKLVDFGFAKQLAAGKKTWTFCGTPEYVAPEVILNKGHDHAVDIWAIGILIYELTSGVPPFAATDPMKTYNIILKGIDAHEFPKRVSKNSQNIIKRLCRPNPSDRLGYQKNGLLDIMKHKWFQGFDWEGLEAGTINSPFKRKVAGSQDTSNFDKYSSEVTLPKDELSGWDEDF